MVPVGDKTFHRQIFIVGYLQLMERKDVHEALCSIGDGASAVGRKLCRRLSVSDIAAPVKKAL